MAIAFLGPWNCNIGLQGLSCHGIFGSSRDSCTSQGGLLGNVQDGFAFLWVNKAFNEMNFAGGQFVHDIHLPVFPICAPDWIAGDRVFVVASVGFELSGHLVT